MRWLGLHTFGMKKLGCFPAFRNIKETRGLLDIALLSETDYDQFPQVCSPGLQKRMRAFRVIPEA